MGKLKNKGNCTLRNLDFKYIIEFKLKIRIK